MIATLLSDLRCAQIWDIEFEISNLKVEYRIRLTDLLSTQDINPAKACSSKSNCVAPWWCVQFAGILKVTDKETPDNG